MAKKIQIILLFIVMVLFLVSCSKEKMQPAPLSEREIAFNEKLTTISNDRRDVSLYYIGTEDGVIFVYNSNNNHIDTLYTKFDRIYKVLHQEDNTYWIATRNMGLFKCVLNGDSLDPVKQYKIPGKETRYSPYDIVIKDGKTYFSTSHGLFVIKNDSVYSISVRHSETAKGSLEPLVFSNLVSYNDYLYCASDTGLIKVNTLDDKDSICINEKINAISMVGEFVFAISEDSEKKCGLNKWNAKNNTNELLQLNIDPAHSLFYEPETNIHYLLGNNKIQLIEETNNYLSTSISLQQALRPSTCHNIILNDSSHHQSLLIAENALLRIPHHQLVYNRTGPVSYACQNGNNVYYLVGSDIYKQQMGTLEADYLMTVCKDVRYLAVNKYKNDEFIYYINNNDEIFVNDGRSNMMTLSKEATAIGGNNNGIYVGIRDGLMQIVNSKDEDTPIGTSPCNIDLYDGEVSVKSPFITVFRTGNDGRLLFGTLNDGVFYEVDGHFKRIKGTEKFKFIRDLAFNCRDSLYILTNHAIFCFNENSSKCDTIDNTSTGFSRLVIDGNKHVLGISEYGICDFNDQKKTYYNDLHINPNSCVQFEGRIYLGSAYGVFTFDSISGNHRAVTFIPKEEYTKQSILILLCSLIFIALVTISIIVFVWLGDRKKSYRDRLQLLKTAVDVIGNEYLSSRIEELSSRIGNLNTHLRTMSYMETARGLNTDIQEMTSTCTHMLINALEEQKTKIADSKKYIGKESYIDETKKVLKEKKFSRMVDQYKKNKSWLDKVDVFKKDYNRLKYSLDYLKIWGSSYGKSLIIDDGFKDAILSAREVLAKYKKEKQVDFDFLTKESTFPHGLAEIAKKEISYLKTKAEELEDSDVVNEVSKEISDLLSDEEWGDNNIVDNMLSIRLIFEQLELSYRLHTIAKDMARFHEKHTLWNGKEVNKTESLKETYETTKESLRNEIKEFNDRFMEEALELVSIRNNDNFRRMLPIILSLSIFWSSSERTAKNDWKRYVDIISLEDGKTLDDQTPRQAVSDFKVKVESNKSRVQDHQKEFPYSISYYLLDSYNLLGLHE